MKIGNGEENNTGQELESEHPKWCSRDPKREMLFLWLMGRSEAFSTLTSSDYFILVHSCLA